MEYTKWLGWRCTVTLKKIFIAGFPKISTRFAAERAFYEGESIHCQAEGLPSPQVNWVYDGSEQNNSLLEITKVETSYQKTYKCVASNTVGNVTKQVKLHVKRKSQATNSLRFD